MAREILKQLKDYLSESDQQIEEVVSNCGRLNKQEELLMSVPGIGKTIALQMMIATKGFASFKNARQFACCAGVAPFEYTSGTSIRGNNRVSHLADNYSQILR